MIKAPERVFRSFLAVRAIKRTVCTSHVDMLLTHFTTRFPAETRSKKEHCAQHHDDRDGQCDECIREETRDYVSDGADTCGGQRVRQLGGHVDDVVTLGTGARHDRRIGYR